MRRWLSWSLLLCAPLLALLLSLHPITNFDVGFHLRTGELIVKHGIPTTDPFSFTRAGAPWYLEQWLGATWFYLIWRLVGIGGLVVFKAVLIGVVFVLVTLTARWMSGNLQAATVGALLAVPMAMVRFRAQPFIFSFVFLALTCLLLERHRHKGGRQLLVLVPLFALWPHVHVGYLYGMVVVAAYFGGAVIEGFAARALRSESLSGTWRRLLGRLALGRTAATGDLLLFGGAALIVAPLSLVCFHPQGWATLERVWGIFNSTFYRHTYQEMEPLAVVFGVGAPTIFLWGLPPLVWLWLRRRLVVANILVFAAFVPSALQVGRMVAVAAIVMAPIFARTLMLAWQELRARGAADNLGKVPPRAVAVALLSVTLLALGAYAHEGYGSAVGWTKSRYPRACYAWIDAHHLPQRFFNDMWFGGSFIFHFYPRRKVFIDGRTVYDRDFLQHVYMPIKLAEPGWQRIVKRLGIEWFLLTTKRFRHLHMALLASPNWRLAYARGICAIYVRADSKVAAQAKPK